MTTTNRVLATSARRVRHAPTTAASSATTVTPSGVTDHPLRRYLPDTPTVRQLAHLCRLYTPLARSAPAME